MAGSPSFKIPRYRLHKPTGLGVVRLNERDIYLGRHDTAESHAEYERVITEWIASGGHALRKAPRAEQSVGVNAIAIGVSSRCTIDELFLRYIAFAKQYYVKNGKPTDEVENLRDAHKPLITLFGKECANDFGPSSLKAVRQSMVEKGWCRNHVNAQVNRIRRAFKWGVENDLVHASVLHGLQAVAPLKRGRCNVRESEPVKPVPEHMLEPVLALVPPPIEAMARLQLVTGMRPGEVALMRRCDITMTGRVWSYRPTSHKTEHHGRDRVIYLGPRAQDILKPYLKTGRQAFLFSPIDAMQARWREQRANRQTPMTPSQAARKRRRNPKRRPGDRYDRGSYAWAIYRACDRAFPPPEKLTEREQKKWRREHRWSPNQLRHNAATHLRRHFGIEAARVVLGHSSADVTEIYAEVDLAKAADIMGNVG